MLAIIAPNADDLRRPHWRQQPRVTECNLIDPSGVQALHISTCFFRRRNQKACDDIVSRERFDQPVLGLAIALKAAIFHSSISPRSEVAFAIFDCQLPIENWPESHAAGGSNRQLKIGVEDHPSFLFQSRPSYYGTLSLASSDRALSLPRTSTAETE